MLKKSLNHKSIIDAFEEVYKEFSQMSETEFKAMIDESELDALGSLLYETKTVTGYSNVRDHFVNIAVDTYKGNAIVHREYNSYSAATNKFAIPSDNYEGGSWLKAA
jgi:hypothetical protein